MKKLAALAAVPLLALAACSSGSGDSASSSSSSSTNAIHTDGLYQNLEGLRAAIREAGIQCPDSIWSPEPASSIDGATGEGKCGSDLRIITTTVDGNTKARGKIASDSLVEAYSHVGAVLLVADVLAYGQGWAATGKDAVVTILEDKMGAQRQSISAAASDAPSPTP